MSAAAAEQVRPGLPQAVAAEWARLASVRSTWWTLGTSLALTVGVAALAAAAGDGTDPVAAADTGLALGQLPLIVLATLAVTAEYGTGSIISTVLAVPVRARVLAAKLVTVSAAVGVTTALASLLAAAVAAALLAAPLEAGPAARLVAVRTATAVLDGVFLVGLASLLRSTAATLVVFIGIGLVLPGVLLAIPSDAARAVLEYLPVMATGVVLGEIEGLYSPGVGWTVLCTWSGLAVAAGGVAFHRRSV